MCHLDSSWGCCHPPASLIAVLELDHKDRIVLAFLTTTNLRTKTTPITFDQIIHPSGASIMEEIETFNNVLAHSESELRKNKEVP